MNRLLFPVFLASSVALGGCASSVVAVKDVTADPEAYQASKFTAAALPENIRKALPIVAANEFGKMEIKKEIVMTGSDDKIEKVESTTVYSSLGNGLVGVRTELSRNGIPFALSYANSYHGLFSLRFQSIPLRGQVTAPIIEVKSITSISPKPIAPSGDFAVKYEASTTMAMMNFTAWDIKCTTGAEFPASQFNAKFVGKAFEVNCVDTFQNTVNSRSKYVYLQHYGLAIQTEIVRPQSKSSYKILDVKI